MPMTTSDSAPIAIDTAIVGDMGGDGTDAAGGGGDVGCTIRSVVDRSNHSQRVVRFGVTPPPATVVYGGPWSVATAAAGRSARDTRVVAGQATSDRFVYLAVSFPNGDA